MISLVVDANVLWKKVRRGEHSTAEASIAGRLLELAGIEFIPMRGLFQRAISLAIALNHPAYDCFYQPWRKPRAVASSPPTSVAG